MKTLTDLTGQRFGLLVVDGPADDMCSPPTRRGFQWWATCDCGSERRFVGAGLRSGKFTHCGCVDEDETSSGVNILYGAYRASARKRGLSFPLTRHEFAEVISLSCHYCGSIPEPRRMAYMTPANGVDRVDSSRGYDKENIVPCCKICNRSKSDMSESDFIAWGLRLGDHLRAKFCQTEEM